MSPEQFEESKKDREKGKEIAQNVLNSKVKDAEMTSLNIIEAFTLRDEVTVKNLYQNDVEELMFARCDLLLHYLQFFNHYIGQGQLKIENLQRDLLDRNIVTVSNDLRAKTHFLIGLTKFMSERVTYFEIKNHLKNALIEADDQ